LGDNVQTTYYVRDLQGNVLAVYEHKHAEGERGTFTLAEQHLYGASRIGMTKPNLALNTTTPEAPVPTIHYELTNHLGNVMAVITDEPAATETPAVESLTDYYPFGMTMPGRSYNAHTSRHGFTGHEKESDLAEGIYTTEYRLYDARVGRWLSVDPLFEKYVGMSPYNYCMLNPVMMVDSDGRKFDLSNLSSEQQKIFNDNINILINLDNSEVSSVVSFLRDNQNFMISIHLNDANNNGFNKNVNELMWDPTKVIVTNLDITLEPVVILSHELKHAYDFNKDYDKPIKQGERYLEKLELEDSAIENAPDRSEDSAIEFETKVYNALNNKSIETTRTDYVSKSSNKLSIEE
jgi:RHS repeat-associated protein